MTMRITGIVLAISLTSACAPCDDGETVPSCVECGPGALRQGRVLGAEMLVAVSPTGSVVRTCGTYDHVAWLAADFSTAHETEIATRSSDGKVVHLAVNAANQVAAVLMSMNDQAEIYEGELAVYEADGKQRWRKLVLGNTDASDQPFVAIGPRRVFMTQRFGPIVAYDLNTGEALWSVRHWGPITADPAGGFLLGGGFNGTLDLGGTAPVLTAPGYAAYVARFDDDGIARSAIALTGTSGARIVDTAAAPGGEIAIVGSWNGPEATLGGTTISAGDGGVNLLVALIGPDGAVQFAHPLGPAYPAGSPEWNASLSSVATDGHEAIVAGTFANRPLTFDPEARTPNGQDAFVASFGATGLAWLRIATGPGDEEAWFDALSDKIVGSFHSDGELQFGDVAMQQEGTTLAELAR